MILRWNVLSLLLFIAACQPTGEASGGGSKEQNGEQTVVRKLSTIDSGYSSSPTDWTAFLSCWSAQFGRAGRAIEEPVDVNTVLDLPMSYRHFVQATGARGWQFPGAKSRTGHGYARYLPLKEVGLFKKVHPKTWKAWSDNRLSVKISDKDYYEYSRKQDLTKFKDEYLDELVMVGDTDDGGVIVLNPSEKSKDGEWEAWYLSTRLAGALRFRSFAELTQMLYFADLNPESDLWSFTDAELASSCAAKLRFSRR